MQDLGKIGYVSRGDYDSNTTYEVLDVVFYNGASFSAKQTTTGNTPTTGRSDDLYWQIMASAASGAIFPMGTITFANLPSSPVVGYLYNISDDFTTDSRFKEGSGVYYPAGSNVYYTSDGYWDVMAGSAVGGVKGNAESTYRTGLVNITPSNLGITSSDITYGTDEKLYLIGAKTQTNNPTTYSDDTIYANANGLVAPTANSTVTYTTGDAADSSVTASTGWTSVAKLTSDLSHSTLMNYISKMFKNVRWLYKKIGTTSMGTSATTVTGAISEINSNLTNKQAKIKIADCYKTATQTNSAYTYGSSLYRINVGLPNTFTNYPTGKTILAEIPLGGYKDSDGSYTAPYETWSGWGIVAHINEAYVFRIRVLYID